MTALEKVEEYNRLKKMGAIFPSEKRKAKKIAENYIGDKEHTFPVIDKKIPAAFVYLFDNVVNLHIVNVHENLIEFERDHFCTLTEFVLYLRGSGIAIG